MTCVGKHFSEPCPLHSHVIFHISEHTKNDKCHSTCSATSPWHVPSLESHDSYSLSGDFQKSAQKYEMLGWFLFSSTSCWWSHRIQKSRVLAKKMLLKKFRTLYCEISHWCEIESFSRFSCGIFSRIQPISDALNIFHLHRPNVRVIYIVFYFLANFGRLLLEPDFSHTLTRILARSHPLKLTGN